MLNETKKRLRNVLNKLAYLRYLDNAEIDYEK